MANRVRRQNRWLVFGLVLLLVLSAISNILVGTSHELEELDKDNGSNRKVVGPKKLIKNSEFSQVSDWETEDAKNEYGSVIFVDYDNNSSPTQMIFYNGVEINDVPFSYKAYLNQTFFKPIWTPNNENALVLNFSYNMSFYHAFLGTPPGTPILGEIYVRLENITSGAYNIWSPVAGTKAIINNDPRISHEKNNSLKLGKKTGSFNPQKPGYYKLSIIFQISTSAVITPVFFIAELRIDDVILMINDTHEPNIIITNSTFGPFRNSSVANVDVDFYSGGFENTSIKIAKFRLNNSGIPGAWNTIFTDQDYYTQNWSLAPIWAAMLEGKNTIEIYCEDYVGNYNDSLQITVIKDTTPPTSKVAELPSYTPIKEFDIDFTASDSVSGSGLDHVELWYLFNGNWYRWNGLGSGEGKFNHSPIRFIAEARGSYGFLTVGYDRAGNLELGGTPDNNPGLVPDTGTFVDHNSPELAFDHLTTKFIKNEVKLSVNASDNTERVEFYYWLDIDKDGTADDPDDLTSSWNKLGEATNSESSNIWTINWNTTNYQKYPEFKDNEHLVVLKAVAYNFANLKSNVYMNDIEVDNIKPQVRIIQDYDPCGFVNPNNIYEIEYSTDIDVISVNIYYRLSDKQDNWSLLVKDIPHNYGEQNGSYEWDFPDAFIHILPDIDIKVKAKDDAGNFGESLSKIYTLFYFSYIMNPFLSDITWYEDFGKISIKLTEYESHRCSDYRNDDLRWYITGNSEELFYISGDNSTGVDADTFVFSSIKNMYGKEVLTYHLHDPNGLEAIFLQTVIVNPVPDPPEFIPPLEKIHVTIGSEDVFDLAPYISDVDNALSELTLSTEDQQHITTDGLKLKFNYPQNLKGSDKTLKVTVRDPDGESVTGTLKLYLSDNHRPRLVGALPVDVEINAGEILENILNLADHFEDPDGDSLTYSVFAGNIKVTIKKNNSINLEAPENIAGQEQVRFRAIDTFGAFFDAYMIVTIIDIPDPPIIRHIPDLNIHYYSSNNAENYSGYGYDFSYFITDPDNQRSELTIWAIAIEPNLVDYIVVDPNNNMGLIFKFPFETADGKRHPVYLYVNDPTNNQVRRLFNISIIIDNWPVELIKHIPDKSIEADGVLENAFKLNDHFYDRDGGTTYDVQTIKNKKLNVEIDPDNYVDISSKDTFLGFTEEVIIIAHDMLPEQYVYAYFEVTVLPGCLPYIPSISLNLKVGEQVTINLIDYTTDIDTPIANLKFESGDLNHVVIAEDQLFIKYNKPGTYNTTIWITDIDGSKYRLDLVVEVKPDQDGNGGVDNTLLLVAGVGIAIVIVVLILILIFFMVLRKKKPNSK